MTWWWWWGGISESTTVNKRGKVVGESERGREGEERRTEVLFITAVGE